MGEEREREKGDMLLYYKGRSEEEEDEGVLVNTPVFESKRERNGVQTLDSSRTLIPDFRSKKHQSVFPIMQYILFSQFFSSFWLVEATDTSLFLLLCCSLIISAPRPEPNCILEKKKEGKKV